MGREHQIAHRDSGCAEDDERQAGLDTEARRCRARAANGRDGLDPAASRQGRWQRQAEVNAAAKIFEEKRGWQAVHRDRADRSANGLRSLLRPRSRLWRVALPRLSAVLLGRWLLAGRRCTPRNRIGIW